MTDTNVSINRKAVSLLIMRVYFAFFLFCSSLFQSQVLMFLGDSASVSIKGDSYITNVSFKESKTKIYIVEGTSVKNFDTIRLANTEIIQVKEEKSPVQKKVADRITNIQTNPLANKNTSKVKNTSVKQVYTIRVLDSENIFSVSRSTRLSIIIPSSSQWEKAILCAVMTIENITVTQQADSILSNETYYHSDKSKSFRVRPPPVVI